MATASLLTLIAGDRRWNSGKPSKVHRVAAPPIRVPAGDVARGNRRREESASGAGSSRRHNQWSRVGGAAVGQPIFTPSGPNGSKGELMPEQGSDADLAAAMSAGDQQAFAAIYERYSDTIYSHCASVLWHPELPQTQCRMRFLLAFAQ